MQLKINGVAKHQVFHPGDSVSGTVQVLIDDKDKHYEVQNINLKLEGRATAQRSVPAGNSSAVDVSDIVLVHQQQRLLTGKYKLGSTQEWDFTMHLPEKAVTKEPGIFEFQSEADERLFDRSLPQPLQPSMQSNMGNECSRISYVLTVELDAISWGGRKHTLSYETPLKVVTFRDEAMRNPVPRMISHSQLFSTASLHLDPEIGDRKLTMGEKLKSTFGREELPQVSYIIDIEMPDVAIISEQIPIFICARLPEAGDDGKKTLPPIELKGISIYLVKKLSTIVQHSKIVGKWEQPVPLASWDTYPSIASERRPVLLNQRIDVRQLTRPRHLLKYAICPDLSTFNINLTHFLSVKGKIEVARKEVEFEIDSKSLSLLSQYCRPMKHSGASTPISAMDNTASDVHLPSYAESSKA